MQRRSFLKAGLLGALALAGLLVFLGGRATLKTGDGPCEGSEARLAGALSGAGARRGVDAADR